MKPYPRSVGFRVLGFIGISGEAAKGVHRARGKKVRQHWQYMYACHCHDRHVVAVAMRMLTGLS